MKKFFAQVRFISPENIFFLIGCIAVLLSVFGPLFYLYAHAPLGTQYHFADGFFYDYYHYLSKIKGGMMGYATYVNRYTDVPQPVTYGHMIFALFGLLSSFLGFYRSDIVYLIARIVSLCVLFSAFWFTVRTLFVRSLYRTVAYIIFFTCTSWYTIARASYGWRAIEPITFSGYYNALSKFPGPPQHLLPAALLLFTFMIFLRKSFDTRSYFLIALMAFVIGMLHPLVGLIGILSFLCMWVTDWLVDKHDARKIILPVGTFICISIIPVGYYAYVFSHVLPWTIWAKTTLENNLQVSFLSFIFANGFFLPFLLFAFPLFRSKPRIAGFLFGWGVIVPCILFPFASTGRLMTLPRLLQIQQYLPLSLLAALGLQYALGNLKLRWQRQIALLICILAIVFAYIPWKTTIMESTASKHFEYYNIFIPNDFMAALDFLEHESSKESVVLTGEYMSSVIPAFTHNRVLLGRGDVAIDYVDKLHGLYMMFGNDPRSDEIRLYLMKYHVSYIIFGVDTPPFGSFYKNLNYLQSIYRSGNVEVVKIIK